MGKSLVAVFFVLHGLVHLWYVVLSQRLVEFQAEMGWTGESWLLSSLLGDAATHSLVGVLYAFAAAGFVAGGIGKLVGQDWWRPAAIASVVLSMTIVVLFWDGSIELIVQKGLVGLLIDVGILAALLLV